MSEDRPEAPEEILPGPTAAELAAEPAHEGRPGRGRARGGRSSGTAGSADSLAALGHSGVAAMATTDVGAHRERARSTRLQRLAMVLGPIALLLILRDLFDPGLTVPTPQLPPSLEPLLPAMALITVLAVVMIVPLLAAGRSPHILYRPDELTMTFDDVRGSEGLVEEVTKTLNLFLAHRTFAEQMGGSPRKAILFEGPPGTGKTYMAKAMAAEAGVPFLFVSSSAFQSMFYGQTNRKIRAYFKALRRHARREGGAIGFIEELDAIGGARGVGQRQGEGIPGVVNELLIQLQSFEQTPVSLRMKGALIDAVNTWLPAHRRLDKPRQVPANILVIGATNRASDLDPALLRPGRFDRNIYFGLPGRAGRRDIIDYYLGKKAHDAGARRPGAARDPGRADRRVLAGDDRAPARRVAGLGAAPGGQPVLVERPAARQDDRGDRSGPARRVHRGRTPDDRHPRGRARHRGLVGRQGSQARSPHHHQAAGRPRTASRTRRRRSASPRPSPR